MSGLDPQFPGDFMTDLANGTLPQVTWIIPPAEQSEHPSFGPEDGENLVDTVITALKDSSAWPRRSVKLRPPPGGHRGASSGAGLPAFPQRPDL